MRQRGERFALGAHVREPAQVVRDVQRGARRQAGAGRQAQLDLFVQAQRAHRRAGEQATSLTQNLLAFSRKSPATPVRIDVGATQIIANTMLARAMRATFARGESRETAFEYVRATFDMAVRQAKNHT